MKNKVDKYISNNSNFLTNNCWNSGKVIAFKGKAVCCDLCKKWIQVEFNDLFSILLWVYWNH